jgi:hypothetical protein
LSWVRIETTAVNLGEMLEKLSDWWLLEED